MKAAVVYRSQTGSAATYARWLGEELGCTPAPIAELERVGIEEGVVLPRPVLEFCYKDDALGDPMVNDSHILALGWATEEELETIKDYALRVNSYLRDFFSSIGIDLVDFKLEFGRTPDGRIVLADEISPDTCRFWDSKTKKKLDKDRFRRDLGDTEGAYKEMLERVFGAK